MKIEVGKTYVTRGGQTVRILASLKGDRAYPFVGVRDDNTREIVEEYPDNGKYYANDEGPHENDLVKEFVPVTYRWWNLYTDTGFSSEHDANASAMSDRAGLGRVAFDPDGNLLPDECVITATKGAGV